MRTQIIGLTGGIGSGKSTIASYFKSLGVPVYIADDEAKKILFLPEVAQEVEAAFGKEILTDGKPDKAKIATLVFNNQEKLIQLNSIIHPKVAQHFKSWVKGNYGRIFVLKETAILFESSSYKDCDAVILVTAPKEIRIARVMIRDGISREKVLERMANQWDDDKKAALSDYVINNSNLESAKAEAYNIYEAINLSKK